MLENIIHGKDISPFITIKDSCEQSGRGLLKSFICHLASQVQKVHVVHYDAVSLEDFQQGLPSHVLSKIVWRDCSKDLLGWDGTKTNITSSLPASASAESEAYIFHSLSPLLMFTNVAYTCQTLHTIQSSKESITPVISLVHKDLHEETHLQLLEHISSTVITVLPSADPHYSGSCAILHKRASGKIIRQNEQYSISGDFSSIDTAEIISMTKNPQQKEQSQGSDPTANLTFNLTLKDNEKQARSQLELPFTKLQEKKPSEAESQIFYQPDEADDFDEEDPDDDLDI